MCPNQEGVVPEVDVTKKIRGATAPLIFQRKPLCQKSGYAPALNQVECTRVHSICTLEYPESFNGYSLVSEYITVQIGDNLGGLNKVQDSIVWARFCGCSS